VKIIVAIAVIVGLAIGIGSAVIQDGSGPSSTTASAVSSKSDVLDPKNLPVEVLKALPDEELAEIFPEKAEEILNPDALDQVKTGGKDSNDPEYLRAVLEKMGADPPVDATTKQLQDMLVHVEDQNVTSK
jgi:hypothetical protein